MADGSLIFDTKLDTGGLLKGLGGGLMKGLAVGLSATTAALAGIGKTAVENYAELEQLEGGVQKLFGAGGKSLEDYAESLGKTVEEASGEYNALLDAQEQVIANANEAYKTAGLSATDYMETVTSFSASLIAGLDGDTVEAARIADVAIRDMSDNANTFGTDIQSIQNAYQGFAKGNFTMLDNLKLGYGGTKEEMVRLVNESGVLGKRIYDVSEISFDQMIMAINATQERMGIAGTTAREAGSTIEGSVNSAKAAWDNLVTGIADDTQDFDRLVDNFVESVVTAGNNLIPRIKTTIEGLGKLVSGLVKEALPKLVAEIPPLLQDLLPVVIESFQYLVQGIASAVPELAGVILDAVPQLIQAVAEMIPALIEAGAQIVVNLLEGISGMLPEVVVQIIGLVPEIVGALMAAASQIGEAVLGIVDSLGDGLMDAVPALTSLIESLIGSVAEAVPQIAERLPELIGSLVSGLLNAVPDLLDAAFELFMTIVEAIPQIIPPLIEAVPVLVETLAQILSDSVPAIMDALINGLMDAVPAVIDAAVSLLMALVDAVPKLIPPLIQAVPRIINALVSGLLGAVPKVLQAAVSLLLAIVDAIPKIINPLVQELPEIITTIIGILTTNIPVILEAAIALFHAILDAIPQIVEALTTALPEIVDTVVDVLVDNIPVLLDAALELLGAILDAIPAVIGELIVSLPQIVETIVTVLEQGITAIVTVGENLIRGLWNGISNMTSWIADKIKGFGQGILDSLKNFFGIHSPSKVMADQVGKNIALGVVKGVDAEKQNAKKSAEELANLYVSAAKSRVSELRKAGKLTEAQEISFWNEMVKHCKKGTKAYNSAAAQAAAAKKSLKKDVSSLTASYVKALAEVQEDLERDILKIRDELDDSIEDLQNTYLDAVASRTKEIAGSFKLFDKVELEDAVDKEDLTQNLEDQVAVLREWEDTLQQLKTRIGDNELYEELQNTDVSALETLKNLNSMTDEELQAYVDLYGQKREIALRQSERENALLKEQTEEQIAALKADADAQIQELQTEAGSQMDILKKTYEAGLKELGITAKKKAKDAGKSVMDGMKAGLKEGTKEVSKTLQDFAKSMLDSVKTELGIHSPSKEFGWVGKMCLEGFDQEFEDFNPYDSLGKAMRNSKNALAMNYTAGIEAEFGAGLFDYARFADKTVEAFDRAGFEFTVDGRTFGRLMRRYQ